MADLLCVAGTAIGAAVILLGCEGAVNQPDVPGFAPKRWRSKSEKGYRSGVSWIAAPTAWRSFGLDHEVFGRAYRVLLHQPQDR